MALFDELLEDMNNVQGELVQINEDLLLTSTFWVDMFDRVIWYEAHDQETGKTVWATMGHAKAPGQLTTSNLHPVNY